MLKNKKGITVISLVITIIILIILAGVSVNIVVGENGIIEKAKQAKTDYEQAQEREKQELLELAQSIDKSIRNEEKILMATNKNKTTVSFEEAQSDARLTSTDNVYTYDAEDNLIFVPAGFKITQEETLVKNGIVIEDAQKNQFVLIPVNGEDITLGRKEFDSTGVIASYSYEENKNQKIEYQINEAHQNYGEGSDIALQYDQTDYDIENFIKRVEENKGFYVSRYEIGDATVTEARTQDSLVTNKPVSKANQFVYNFVSFDAAMQLANEMYTSDKFTSTLCNSYAYDTMMEFIVENSGKINYATGKYGNLKDSEENAVLCKTGMYGDVVCNLYDVAGNVREYNTETYLRKDGFLEGYHTIRGGGFGFTSTQFSAGSRGYTNKETDKTGFRVMIY